MSPKRHRQWPQFILPLLILAVGIGGFLVLRGLKQKPPKHPPKTQGPLVEVWTVFPQDRQIVLSATGVTQSWQKIDIYPQVAGKVVWVSPKFVAGGYFKKGQPFFQIERADYEAILTQTEAKVAQAQENLALIEHKAQVARKQWTKIFGSKKPPSPLVFYQPQLKAAKAALKAAQAEREKALLNLKRTTITAPFDCLVVEEHVARGLYVSPGKPVARILGTEKMQVIAPLALRDVAWLKIPTSCQVLITTNQKIFTYPGRVVRLLPVVEEKARLPQLVVEVSDPYQLHHQVAQRPDLLEGLFVQLQIPGRTVKGVYVLPRSVLHRDHIVWLVDQNQRLVFKRVKIIFSTKDQVYVKGLTPGDRVVKTHLEGVAPGLKVRIWHGASR